MIWRIATFSGGLVAAGVAVASPLAHLDHHLLTAHMVQHLLLMLVAAPLVLLGARAVQGVRWRPYMAFCWLAGSGTVIFWHVPFAFELALKSNYWHVIEHASFFVGGILFWWPVVHPGLRTTGWSLPLYLFLATLPCDALSAFLAFCGHVVYPRYLKGYGGMYGLSPLDDQALAGALMWVTVTFAYLIPVLVVITRLLSSEQRYGAEVQGS